MTSPITSRQIAKIAAQEKIDDILVEANPDRLGDDDDTRIEISETYFAGKTWTGDEVSPEVLARVAAVVADWQQEDSDIEHAEWYEAFYGQRYVEGDDDRW